MASLLGNDREDWLASGAEPAIDPDREIVDPHHHLWSSPFLGDYLAAELHADLTSGHNVVQTVYMECHSGYRAEGPEHLRSVGETELVVEQAADLAPRGRPVIAALVGNVDLRLPIGLLDEAFDAHVAASGGMFRGVRHAGARAPEGVVLRIPGAAPEGLYADPDFRRGVAHLGERGFSFDSWHYHVQNGEFLALAEAVPGTTMVIDHFGTPIGVGPYAGAQDAVFATWKDEVAAIADRPNVVAKLGGLAMPDNGYGFGEQERPPSSDDVVAAQGRWYERMLEVFGADRCMFESNFPVDRHSMPYGTYWNAMKKLAAGRSEEEKDALFSGTARRVYRIGAAAPA